LCDGGHDKQSVDGEHYSVRTPCSHRSIVGITNNQQSLAVVAAAGHSGGLAPIAWYGGLLVAAVWLARHFGPAIARTSGMTFCWIGFMVGIENAYGYAAFFIVVGVAAWRGGTAWHLRRHGAPPRRLWPAAIHFLRQSSQPPGAIPPPWLVGISRSKRR
jgi:hypothetical protein